MKIGIIGAGFAGLATAYKLEQLLYPVKIALFDKSNRMGGRIFSRKLKNKIMDVGSNFLTFDMLKHPERTVSQIKSKFNRNLIKIEKPLFLYEESIFRLGDDQSDKYIYKNGIEQLSYQLQQKLRYTWVVLNSNISEIKNDHNGWSIINDNEVYKMDMLVMAAPIPDIAHLLKNHVMGNQIQDIKYSQQITATFKLKNQIEFSCVLFKNHDITFICSHEQKTGSNLINIQMNEKFSQQNWKLSDKVIAQSILSLIPQNVPVEIEQDQGHFFVCRQYPSHRKSKSIFQDIQKRNLYFCGDNRLPRSRVVSSFESGILTAEKISKKLSL